MVNKNKWEAKKNGNCRRKYSIEFLPVFDLNAHFPDLADVSSALSTHMCVCTVYAVLNEDWPLDHCSMILSDPDLKWALLPSIV